MLKSQPIMLLATSSRRKTVSAWSDTDKLLSARPATTRNAGYTFQRFIKLSGYDFYLRTHGLHANAGIFGSRAPVPSPILWSFHQHILRMRSIVFHICFIPSFLFVFVFVFFCGFSCRSDGTESPLLPDTETDGRTDKPKAKYGELVILG